MKLRMKFSPSASSAISENTEPHHFPIAAMAALNTSDTIIRKPMPSMIPNDNSRDLINAQIPLFLVSRGACHMRSNAP